MERMRHFGACILIELALMAQMTSPVFALQAVGRPGQVSTLELAGIMIEIELPFALAEFVQPARDDAQQAATAVSWTPFFEVSLEATPTNAANLSKMMRTLQVLRAGQAGSGLPGRQISFFGRPINGISNRVMLDLRAAGKEAVIVHEWITQAYERTWTFRISYTPGQDFDESLLGQVIIRAVGLAPGSAPSILLQAVPQASAGATDLPSPVWWQGDCDTNYYYSKSGKNAYALGGSYRGIKACGPRPWYDEAPDVLVRFYSGAWGEYEWECVELSMRFLYLAYGIPPYSGNGKDVVTNYPGTLLAKISNGTIGKAPQPGDVLSYGPTTTYGHTSVVSASNVDASGNGTITVIEQNSSATGVKTLTVTNWVVQASSTVSGWLHMPEQTVEMPYRVYIPVTAQ